MTVRSSVVLSHFYFMFPNLWSDIGKRSWSKDKLVKSAKEGSHESMTFGNVNFTLVIYIKLCPGSWEEFGHV